MLGDKIGEAEGQVIGVRVIPGELGPGMETTFRAAGRLLGVETTDTGTYVGRMRANGTIYGEGEGITMGATGEMATWKAAGVGIMSEDGSVSFRGAIYYDTPSEAWTRLGQIASVYEFEQAADGSVSGTLWEWS